MRAKKIKPIATVEIPHGGDPEGMSMGHRDIRHIRLANECRVWVGGTEITNYVCGFAVTNTDGAKTLMLELINFEIFEADGILGAEELA